MIKKNWVDQGILSVNGRITCDASCDDTTWPRRPELEAKEVFNWQISKRREVLIEVMCELNKKGSREINKQEDKKESTFN